MAEELTTYKDNFEKLLKDTKFDLAQNIVSKVLPLEQIVHIKIAITLWQQCISNEMQHVLSSTYCSKRAVERLLNYMNTYQQGILEKVPHLMLTKYCEETLKQMINRIGNEISCFLSSLFCHELQQLDTKNILKLYLDNLRWTQNGSINKFKTVVQLIDHEEINTLEKYILACNFCLEDKARELIGKVPTRIINAIIADYENFDCHPYHLVLFWTLYISEKIENYSVITHGVATNVYLMKCSIFSGSEASVQYIWENNVDNTLKDALIYYATMTSKQSSNNTQFPKVKLNHANILLYLLAKMDQVQLKQTCVMMGYDILESIWNSAQWRHVFLPATEYIMKLFSYMETADYFSIVAFLYHKKLFNFVEYKQLWKQYSRSFEINNRNFISVFDRFLYEPELILKDNTILLKWLMKIGPVHWKRYIMFRRQGLFACIILIWNGKLDIFDMFLKKMLTTRDRRIFKNILFRRMFNMICFSMIERNKYALLEKILTKFYEEEDLKIFKRRLPYIHMANLVLQMITARDDDRIKSLDKFLTWCFNGSDIEIQRFKRVVFDLQGSTYHKHKKSLIKYINILIRREKWDLVDLGLKWIFYAVDSKNINTWNKKLARIKLILHLAYGKHGGKWLKRFVTSCFQEREVEKLKDKLKASMKLVVIVKDMFHILHCEKWFENVKNTSQEVDSLLDWCFSSDKEKINEFKKCFMVSKGCIILLNLITEKRCNYKMVPLFEWFDPSIEAATLFKEKFLRFLLTKRRSLMEKHKSAKLSNKNYWKILWKRATASLDLLTSFSKNKLVSEDDHNARKRLKFDHNKSILGGINDLYSLNCFF